MNEAAQPVVTSAIITAVVVIAGVVANYAVTRHEVKELRIAVEQARTERTALSVRFDGAVASINAKLEPFAVLAFEIAAIRKAIDTNEKELRLARTKIHNLDNALGKVLLLMHLIREGVKIPGSAIDRVSSAATAEPKTEEEET